MIKRGVGRLTKQDALAAVPLRTEDELLLLLLCARARMTPAQVDRIRTLMASGVNWEALLEAASWHGVLPLLTQNVLAVCPGALPTPIRESLLSRRESLARTNRILALELVRLLWLFKQQGIGAIGFKGPVLAASVYGDLALREFGDLDILVRRRDRRRAHRLLVAQGYHVSAYPSHDIVFLQRLTLSHNQCRFEHPRTAMIVELHWRINPRLISLPLDSPGFWRRLERRRLLSTTVLDLSAEDLLLQLCIHGSKHIWARMKYVCDVAACLERYPELNWPQLVVRARRLHSERMLFLALDLVHRLLSMPLPEPITEAISADPTVAALSARLAARLIARQDLSYRFSSFEVVPYLLQFKSRRRDRLLICWYLIHPIWLALQPSAKDRALVCLPKQLAPLYYLIRPFRIGAVATLLIMRIVARGICAAFRTGDVHGDARLRSARPAGPYRPPSVLKCQEEAEA